MMQEIRDYKTENALMEAIRKSQDREIIEKIALAEWKVRDKLTNMKIENRYSNSKSMQASIYFATIGIGVSSIIFFIERLIPLF